MSHLRNDINSLFQADDRIPSLTYWAKLLDYFETHKSELDINDVRLLEEECDRVHVFLNTSREVIRTIIRPSGKIQHIPTLIKGLGIEKDETNPNIYVHLAEMERREEALIEEKKRRRTQPVLEDHGMIPLAASA